MKKTALACLLAAAASTPRGWAQVQHYMGCATTDGWEARDQDQMPPNDPRDGACRLPNCMLDYCENNTYVCACEWNHTSDWHRFYSTWGHDPDTSTCRRIRPYQQQGDKMTKAVPMLRPMCGTSPQARTPPTVSKPAKTPTASGNPGSPGYGTLYDNLNGAPKKSPAAQTPAQQGSPQTQGSPPLQGTPPMQGTPPLQQPQQQQTAPAPPNFEYQPMQNSSTQQWIQHQREMMQRQAQKVKKSTDSAKDSGKDDDSDDDQ